MWARRTEQAEELAEQCGSRPFDDLDALFDAVEAVLFCVPPNVQATLATRAAEAGCHLLLDKPLGLTLDQARGLADVIERTSVRSQVFLTARYNPVSRAFIETCHATDLLGVSMTMLSGAALPGGPFATPWRVAEGALLDVGPHALDLVEACAGSVVDITSEAGRDGLVAITCRHETGAVSQILLSISAAAEDSVWRLEAYDRQHTFVHDRPAPEAAIAAAQTALSEFAHAVRTGGPIEVDAARGLVVQELLERARSGIAGG